MAHFVVKKAVLKTRQHERDACMYAVPLSSQFEKNLQSTSYVRKRQAPSVLTYILCVSSTEPTMLREGSTHNMRKMHH